MAHREWKADAGGCPVNGAVQFSESMAGSLVPGRTCPEGKPDVAPTLAIRITPTIFISDIDSFVASPEHRGRITGVIDLEPFGTGISAPYGTFQLFVNSGSPDVKWMVYELAFEHSGRPYYLAGKKHVRAGPITSAWRDTTTLFTQLHDGPDASHPIIAAGVLRLGLADLLKMAGTFRCPGSSSLRWSTSVIAKFLRFFISQLWDSYGFHRQLDPVEPPNWSSNVNTLKVDIVRECPPIFGQRRVLRFPPLERYELRSGDGKLLMLHHTSGGTRGPVILSPGTAMTALTYCVDTVPQNLVEFLVAEGFDVWLFDWRTSPLLTSHKLPYTLDDVARYDWPAAIAQVRSLTGKDQVTILAHCLSSPCLLLSLLRGYTAPGQVRALTASQVALHLKLTTVGTVKVNMRFDRLLPGGQVIHQMHAQETIGLSDVACTILAHLLPKTYTCDNRACDRQSATFGELILHSRVEPATHGLMGDLVPECNMGFLKDVAVGVRSASLMRGDDASHLDRLRLPIFFISGSENRMFVPASTAATYEMLCAANGTQFYERKVYEGFGHLDCYLGHGAPQLIWPDIAAALAQ
jgi:cholesterol oxidase